MPENSVFVDNGHVLICGITGSKDDMGGKTALANWWLDTWGKRFDLQLFINPNGIPSVYGDRVESIDELADSMHEGNRHINYVPQTADWEGMHNRIQRFIAELPSDMSKIVCHDEAPEYGDSESLTWFVRRAGQESAYNTKSLIISQSPGDLPTTVRRQCPSTVWIGPTSTSNKHWFVRNDYEGHFEHIEETHEPYEWTLMEGPRESDRTTYRPVPEDYA